MALHPLLGAMFPQRLSTNQGSTTVAATIAVTTAATAYNNITPVQLVASTPADACGFTIRHPSISVTNTRRSLVFEIMAGGSGSEYTIIGPVSLGHSTSGWFYVPIFIPAGTRLSIRTRATQTSAALQWGPYWLHHSPNAEAAGLPQRWVCYGLVDDASANAQGTSVTPGASGAWGSWTSLTTSTTYAHDLWMPMIDGYDAASVAANQHNWSQFAIASTTDAATMGTNVTTLPGPQAYYSTSESIGEGLQQSASLGRMSPGPRGGIVYSPAPAGSAVSARIMSNVTTPVAMGCSILAAI
jgi:hypothetical protein